MLPINRSRPFVGYRPTSSAFSASYTELGDHGAIVRKFMSRHVLEVAGDYLSNIQLLTISQYP